MNGWQSSIFSKRIWHFAHKSWLTRMTVTSSPSLIPSIRCVLSFFFWFFLHSFINISSLPDISLEHGNLLYARTFLQIYTYTYIHTSIHISNLPFLQQPYPFFIFFPDTTYDLCTAHSYIIYWYLLELSPLYKHNELAVFLANTVTAFYTNDKAQKCFTNIIIFNRMYKTYASLYKERGQTNQIGIVCPTTRTLLHRWQ